MSRFAIPARDDTPADSKATLDAVNAQIGFVPNLQRLMSQSPHVLNGWFGLMTELNKALDTKTRMGIALATSEANGCDYCLSAHSYIAKNKARMAPEEIGLLRDGISSDRKRGVAATFAQKIVQKRGHVSDNDLTIMRAAGFTEKEMLEIAALSTLFAMTNFMNNLAETDIDFPQVEPAKYLHNAYPYGENSIITCGVGG